LATIFAASFFFGVPHLAQTYWPQVLELKEQYGLGYTQFFLMWSLT
jgi:hypothetical protein